MNNSYNLTWEFQNNTGSGQVLTDFLIQLDNITHGYYKTGSYSLEASGDIMAASNAPKGPHSALNGLEVKGLSILLVPGQAYQITATVTTEDPLTPGTQVRPPGFALTPGSPDSAGRLRLTVRPERQVSAPGGGGGPGGGSGGGIGKSEPVSIEGGAYKIYPPAHDCVATVARWSYPPLFGVKVLTPPPPPPQLFYPTTAGPNYEGSIDGLLLTPATVRAIPQENGGTASLEVAGVKFKFWTGDLSSTVAVGILPFKE